MKRTIAILIKGLIILLIVSWIALIVVEYFRYQDNDPMLVVLKEETLTYDDGHVYITWGLGYKTITYERTSIYGKQFGPIFIVVKDELPE